jgi:predicted AAA+ superfamily ATPase
MLCHYHGGIFNASELGKSLGISYHTAKNHLDILHGTFMIRILQPWYENIKKRQVKTPKIYFRDSGIYHALLGLADYEALTLSPKIGASWEGFALEQIINLYKAEAEECYFWSSHNTSEIDLLIFKHGQRLGFEFKYTDVPRITSSIKITLADLKLDEVKIIFPGNMRFHLSDKVEAIGLNTLIT